MSKFSRSDSEAMSAPSSIIEDLTKPEIDLQEFLRIFWRRKWVIVISVLLCIVIAALHLSQQTSRYTASASLILNTRESNVVDVEAILSGRPPDATAVIGEMEIIRSSQLILRVVEKLRLSRDPEFNASLREPTWQDRLTNLETYLSRDILVHLGLRKEVDPTEALIESEDDPITAVVNAVQDRLTVKPVQQSLVIQVSFESDDAGKAALIANTIADQYIVDQLEAKFEATTRATVWLNDRLSELKDDVEASEAAVERFKAAMSVGSGQGVELTVQQLTALNSELILARTARAEAEARYREVGDLISSAGIEAAANVISSPLIDSLREQLADLRREEAQNSASLGDLHPTMIDIRAQISDTTEAIANEVRKVAANLETELQVARTRERTLEQSLEDLEQRSIEQSASLVELRQLEREAEANQIVYQNFLSRFKETEEQDKLQEADARIISLAQRPKYPSYPNKTLILSIALICGVLLGVVIVVLLEKLDNAYRSPEQIERDLGLATLSMIPLVGRKRRRRHVLEYFLQKPTSALAESARSLRTAIYLSNVDKPPQVVLVTSSLPSEGKSTTALLLALASTASDKTVVLVDCDLRRPTLHSTLNVDNERSLVDYLNGTLPLDEVLHTIEEGAVNVIPARATAANAIDLLSSERFSALIKALRERFDVVVLDPAPSLAVSDSLIVGRQCDAVVYALKWDSTPRKAVRAGVRMLRDAGLNLSGVVLTQVDMKRHVRYGYGDYGTYYGKYKDYYQS